MRIYSVLFTVLILIAISFTGCKSNDLKSFNCIEVTSYDSNGVEVETSDISRNQNSDVMEKLENILTTGEKTSQSYEDLEKEQKYRLVFTNIGGLLGDDIAPVYFDLYLYQDSIVFGKMVKKDNGTMIVEDSYQLAKGLTVDEFKEIIENTHNTGHNK